MAMAAGEARIKGKEARKLEKEARIATGEARMAKFSSGSSLEEAGFEKRKPGKPRS
jgi:hypothetical protein